MDIVKRSEVGPSGLRYSVEVKAPAGNWVMVMGTSSKDSAVSYGKYEASHNSKDVRIVDEAE